MKMTKERSMVGVALKNPSATADVEVMKKYAKALDLDIGKKPRVAKLINILQEHFEAVRDEVEDEDKLIVCEACNQFTDDNPLYKECPFCGEEGPAIQNAEYFEDGDGEIIDVAKSDVEVVEASDDEEYELNDEIDPAGSIEATRVNLDDPEPAVGEDPEEELDFSIPCGPSVGFMNAMDRVDEKIEHRKTKTEPFGIDILSGKVQITLEIKNGKIQSGRMCIGENDD